MLDTDHAVEEIARRIRAWRAEASLTLQQLAQRSGVAASTIHKVESQHMVPTIAVLLKITRGLNRRPSDLLADDSWTSEIAFRSASDAEEGPVRQVSCELRDPKISVHRIELAPGRGLQRQPLTHDGEIALLCEHGQLLVSAAGKPYKLHPGDTIQFKTQVEIEWANGAEGPTRFLLIGTDAPELTRLLRAITAQSGPAAAPTRSGMGSPGTGGGSRSAAPAVV